VPPLDDLTAGPDALDLTLETECAGPQALWQRIPVEVGWTWRGLDVFGGEPDRLTLAFTSPGPAQLSWDPTDTWGYAFPDLSTTQSEASFNIPKGMSEASYSINLVQSGDGTPTPVTITATYTHAGAWSTTKTATCRRP